MQIYLESASRKNGEERGAVRWGREGANTRRADGQVSAAGSWAAVRLGTSEPRRGVHVGEVKMLYLSPLTPI